MTDLSSIDTVSDIFPSYPRSELAARLLCANSVDELIEELFAEQQPKPAHYDVGVYRLKDMFPKMPLDILAARLQKHNGDVMLCIDGLMTPDVAHQLSELLGIPLEKLRKKLNEIKKKKGAKVPLKLLSGSNDETVDPSNTLLLQAVAEIIFEDIGLAWNSAEIAQRRATQQEIELKCQIKFEPLLQRLNYNFLKRSLKFFNNELGKVLEVAYMFIEAGLEEFLFTFDPRYSGASALVPLATPESSVWGRNQSAQSQAIANANVLGLRMAPRALSTNQSSFSTYLDLHGYTVAEAISLVESTVAAWWGREQELRVKDGRLEKQGAKANFVEYLVIITGRGLHSLGGPKIRTAVIKVLNGQNYIFQEQVGLLHVQGKRK